MADTDPLEYQQRRHPDLDVITHGLTLWDLDREFPTGGFGGKPLMKLRDILGVLRDSYCRTRRRRVHAHPGPGAAALDPGAGRAAARRSRPRDEQMHILCRLNAAEAFETFLQTKYVGQKRFSLEGGESRHPAAGRGARRGRRGRARRGRHRHAAPRPAERAGQHRRQAYAQIFREFEGNLDPQQAHGSGDVKYHLGAEGKFTAPDGDADQGLAGRQPVAPGGGRPGAGGHRPGQAGPARPGRARASPCCRC